MCRCYWRTHRQDLPLTLLLLLHFVREENYNSKKTQRAFHIRHGLKRSTKNRKTEQKRVIINFRRKKKKEKCWKSFNLCTLFETLLYVAKLRSSRPSLTNANQVAFFCTFIYWIHLLFHCLFVFWCAFCSTVNVYWCACGPSIWLHSLLLYPLISFWCQQNTS